MDPVAYMLMSKTTGNILYDIFLMIIIIPIIGIFIGEIKNYLINNIKIFNIYKYNSIEFSGYEYDSQSSHYIDFSIQMKAILYYALLNNKVNNVKQVNINQNGAVVYNNLDEKNMCFIINNCNNKKISDNIILNITSITNPNYNSEQNNVKSHKTEFNIVLKSNKNISHIKKFVEECVIIYKNYLKELQKNKLYHFIFQGKKNDTDNLSWSQNLLSDNDDEKYKNYETFDFLISKHNNILINDIERLRDIEYYKNTGNKRKKGYLFYGPPGTGKTASVVAMALYDKRHIIEVPICRLKTNKDIEAIINLTQINNVEYSKDQIIFLFDEIDTGIDSLQKRESEITCEKDTIIDKLVTSANKNILPLNDDKINLGSLLSRLDGVGFYGGVIFVATTNCIDKISPALYRHGRLNPLYFDYMTKEDIILMIEKALRVKLSFEQVSNLPSLNDKISASSVKKYIEDYSDVNELLKFLSNIVDNKN